MIWELLHVKPREYQIGDKIMSGNTYSCKCSPRELKCATFITCYNVMYLLMQDCPSTNWINKACKQHFSVALWDTLWHSSLALQKQQYSIRYESRSNIFLQFIMASCFVCCWICNTHQENINIQRVRWIEKSTVGSNHQYHGRQFQARSEFRILITFSTKHIV